MAATEVQIAKNTTQTYDVGGYGVEIVYNSSGVKSVNIVSGSGDGDNGNSGNNVTDSSNAINTSSNSDNSNSGNNNKTINTEYTYDP